MDTVQSGRFARPGCALIVVDVQNDFCHRDGALANAGQDTSAMIPMARRLRALIQTARHHEVPVVFIRTTHDDSTDTAAWISRRERSGVGGTLKVMACRTGTWGADYFEVAPLPSEKVVTKHRYSAFVNTALDASLRSIGVTSLFFTGVATDVCVETSLREALCRDYHVTLVSDCCATFSTGAHEATLATVERNFGAVMSASEVAEQWAEVASWAQ